jgi:hypothetical protein
VRERLLGTALNTLVPFPTPTAPGAPEELVSWGGLQPVVAVAIAVEPVSPARGAVAGCEDEEDVDGCWWRASDENTEDDDDDEELDEEELELEEEEELELELEDDAPPNSSAREHASLGESGVAKR